MTGARILTLGAALLAFAPATHASTFLPPQGCTLKMTVQLRGCTVAQQFICAADAPGDQWVTYFDQQGPRFSSRIDAETRWMESINLRNGIIDTLEPEAEDHASFSTLLETGHDDFDFWTRSNTGERLRNIGADRLTGESVVIDGVALQLTEFQLNVYAESGELLIETSGQQFVSADHGRFYGGVEQSRDWIGERRETNDSPVSFAMPGDAGFGATKPLYDCDMQLATLLTEGRG
ncbi:MAG: hypothetical protein Q4G26_15540 [Paracoccus sp. (in: a-proteobacteria)]|nr:hypothetical protein [Paracoccus sp. (in: a-proteobacteria)]